MNLAILKTSFLSIYPGTNKVFAIRIGRSLIYRISKILGLDTLLIISTPSTAQTSL